MGCAHSKKKKTTSSDERHSFHASNGCPYSQHRRKEDANSAESEENSQQSQKRQRRKEAMAGMQKEKRLDAETRQPQPPRKNSHCIEGSRQKDYSHEVKDEVQKKSDEGTRSSEEEKKELKEKAPAVSQPPHPEEAHRPAQRLTQPPPFDEVYKPAQKQTQPPQPPIYWQKEKTALPSVAKAPQAYLHPPVVVPLAAPAHPSVDLAAEQKRRQRVREQRRALAAAGHGRHHKRYDARDDTLYEVSFQWSPPSKSTRQIGHAN